MLKWDSQEQVGGILSPAGLGGTPPGHFSGEREFYFEVQGGLMDTKALLEDTRLEDTRLEDTRGY